MKPPFTHINGIELFERKVGALSKNKDLLSRARSLRKGYILSEVIFWKQVRNKTFHNLDIDRQRIIGNYIVDFYIKSFGIVVEIDGSSHNEKEDYDAKRDGYLESLGLYIYHISDLRVKNDLVNVMKELEDFMIEKFSWPKI